MGGRSVSELPPRVERIRVHDRADANRPSLSRVHGSKVRWAEP